ncbi:hypothetical protein BGZ60DRAFT_437166 [Tricladium varicosporioides]|nr:hypothetical protein BGZ60DRAFT_437166 [Hymenoscyphus varicosporioides]
MACNRVYSPRYFTTRCNSSTREESRISTKKLRKCLLDALKPSHEVRVSLIFLKLNGGRREVFKKGFAAESLIDLVPGILETAFTPCGTLQIINRKGKIVQLHPATKLHVDMIRKIVLQVPFASYSLPMSNINFPRNTGLNAQNGYNILAGSMLYQTK